MVEHCQRVAGIGLGAGVRQCCSVIEEEPLMGSIRRGDELCDMVVHEAGIHMTRHELGVLQQVLQKWDVGGYSLDFELTERAVRPRHHSGEVCRRGMSNELG